MVIEVSGLVKMDTKKVSITTSSFGKYDKVPLQLLEEAGYGIILNPHGRTLQPGEIIELCKDSIGVIAGTEKLDAPVLRPLLHLKVISRCGAGMDNVDLQAAKRQGIKVLNTPDAPTQAVAELTVGLILNLLRKVNIMDVAVKSAKWEKLMGNLLCGKKVGIIGFGRIGKGVAGFMRAFGCEIAYADPYVEIPFENARRASLDELLGWADIVTLHLSTGEKVMGLNEFRQMKKGAWFVNVSRGSVVDEEALYVVLQEGHLAGAALDVYAKEPYTGSLKKCKNVILTPHIGSYAVESRVEMEKQAAKNLLEALGGF